MYKEHSITKLQDSVIFLNFENMKNPKDTFCREVYPEYQLGVLLRWRAQQANLFKCQTLLCHSSAYRPNSFKHLPVSHLSTSFWTYGAVRMCGNAQLDGRPLLPPIECYWLVNASPLNYRRWVGQNFGPVFRRLWTKVHRIKFACVGVFVVCKTVFRLMISWCVPEIFAIKSWSCPKSRQNFVLCRQISGGRGLPDFWSNFINLVTVERVAKFGDDRPRDL